MKWELEWGSSQNKQLLEIAKEQFGEESESLRKRPKLSQWNAQYVEAWKYLKTSRPVGQGAVAPIPVSEIAAYLNLIEEKDVDERQRYIRMVSALDSEYVEKINQKLKAERDSQMRKSKARHRGRHPRK